LLCALFFVSCEQSEERDELSNRSEGIVQSRIDENGVLRIALVMAPKKPGQAAPSLAHLRGVDFLEVESQEDVRAARASRSRTPLSDGVFSRANNSWILSSRTMTPYVEAVLGVPGEPYTPDPRVERFLAYTSTPYVCWDRVVDLTQPRSFTYSHGAFQGTAEVFREGQVVYARINGGVLEVAASNYQAEGTRAFVQVVLPIEGSICQMGMDNELMEEVTGTWTLSANPPIEPNRPSLGDPGLLVGGTPFSFEIAGLVVEDVVADKKPDVENPVSGQMLSGGAVFRAQTRMLGQSPGEPDYLGQPYRLAWKATVYAEGGDNVRTLYGSGGSPGSEIAVDWDGTDDGGKRVPAEKTYGVMLEVLQNRFEGSAISPRGTVMAVTPGYGPEGVLPGGGGVTITPNPYIPYTAEEQQHTFDEYGNPMWFDDDEDGYPDRFPDHDGDGEPDFEPGEPPPGIFIRPAIIKPGFDLSRWELKILSEDGEVLHTRVEENARNRFGSNGEYEWKSSDIPADLEPQELKVEIVPTYCRRTAVDIQVLAQGTPGTECGPGATLEGTVAFGRSPRLEIVAPAGSEQILATSADNATDLNDAGVSRLSRVNKLDRWRVRLKGLQFEGDPPPRLSVRLEGQVSRQSQTVELSDGDGDGVYEVTLPATSSFIEADVDANDYAHYDIPGLQDSTRVLSTALDGFVTAGMGLAYGPGARRLGTLSYLDKAEPQVPNRSVPENFALGSRTNFTKLGFEDVKATFAASGPNPELVATIKTQNRAARVHCMVHGGDDAGIQLTRIGTGGAWEPDIFFPSGLVVAGDLSHLRTLMLTSCNVLDVYDYNNKRVNWPGARGRTSPEDPISIRSDPGKKWWNATRQGSTVLLGYNFPVLRVEASLAVQEYFTMLKQMTGVPEAKRQQYAWLRANERLEFSCLNACAWDSDFYYYISFDRYSTESKPRILRIPLAHLEAVTPSAYSNYSDGVPAGAELVTDIPEVNL
jgi:hypothetical protein